MLHFGVMCPEVSGHLNPMMTLSHELQKRGHTVTFIGTVDAEAKVLASGFGYEVIGKQEFPEGAWSEVIEKLGKSSSWRALFLTGNSYQKMAGAIVRDAPEAVRRLNIDGLLVDQTYPAGSAVADHADLPFVTVCNALLMNVEPNVPPMVSSWKYRSVWWSRLRNRAAHWAFHTGTGGTRRVLQRHQRQWGCPVYRRNDDSNSSLAQIAQLPRAFDYPRSFLPETFHYVGPLHNLEDRPSVPFDFGRLDGRPLIYASMGTLQNRLQHVFQKIAVACADLDAQLVISLGRADAELPKRLPGNPLVVPYAPQLELIQRAKMVVTHAGMNTVLECLAQGVPMASISVTNDQPGVAGRIRWTGAGENVPIWMLTTRGLRRAVRQVFERSTYRTAALKLQEAIQQSGGAIVAADIAEQAIRTGQAVTASSLAASAMPVSISDINSDSDTNAEEALSFPMSNENDMDAA